MMRKVGQKLVKKKKKRKKSKVNNSVFGGIILVIVILTVSLVLAVGGISIGMEYYGIGKTDEDIRFNIPAGSTNSEIADILVNEGVIKNKKLFMLALKFEKPAAIYPGDITLQPSSGYSEIIEKLSQMRESYKTVSITFTEGENLLDIAKKLEDNEVCTADCLNSIKIKALTLKMMLMITAICSIAWKAISILIHMSFM